jgi:6-phosphogluconolactonase
MAQLTVVRDKAQISETGAERITSLIEGAIVIRNAAAISLTGGHTPDLLYEYLADPDRPWRARIDWARVHLFWSDERNVSPDHPESNFGLANRTLIQHVPIPASHVHRMRGERPAVDAGREYDVMLRARRDEIAGPLFDVTLLGIGVDAHIASIFPDTPLLLRGPKGSTPHVHSDPSGTDLSSTGTALFSSGADLSSSGADLSSSGADLLAAPKPRSGEGGLGPRALATGVWVPKLNQWRITQTPPALLDSTAIIVMAAGSTKADAIATSIGGELNVSRYPAQLLRAADDRVEWIVDDAAARSVSGRPMV